MTALIKEFFRTQAAHQRAQTDLMIAMLNKANQSRGVQVGDLVPLEDIRQAHMDSIVHSTATLDEAAEILGINPATIYRRKQRTASVCE